MSGGTGESSKWYEKFGFNFICRIGLFDVVLAPAMIKTKIDQSGNQINLTVQRRNVEEVMSGQSENILSGLSREEIKNLLTSF